MRSLKVVGRIHKRGVLVIFLRDHQPEKPRNVIKRILSRDFNEPFSKFGEYYK